MQLSFEDQVTTITRKHEKHPANEPGRNLMRDPEDMRLLCANCHEQMIGRPLRGKDEGGVPQVVIEGHGGTAQCTSCHNPHSPRVDFTAIPRPPVDPKTGKALPASAEKPGDANAGKAAAAMCGACHGETGVSANPMWPSLAGQQPGYLASSLKAFKDGVRKNDLMSPMAAALSDADMQNLSAYFAKASCSTPGGDKAKAELGKAKAAAAGCAACHSSGGLRSSGKDGVSASQAWPNLAGQHADYLVSALKSFQDGSRNHAVMTDVAKTLSASDIDNLAAYYASVSCK
jgi:cytochrome c553